MNVMLSKAPGRSLSVALGMAIAIASAACGGAEVVKEGPAAANDLQGKKFEFTDGAAFHSGLAGDPVTLSFGTFAGSQGTFNLSSGGNTASGSVTIGSCIYTVVASTFPPGTGPQVGDKITAECDVVVTQDGVTLSVAANGQTSESEETQTMTGSGGG